MILVDHMIRNEIELGRMKITPFDDSLINPSSLDVRLGEGFSKVSPANVCIDPSDPLSFRTQRISTGSYKLLPGDTVLSTIQEHITLPADISGKMMGKSSLGRLGLDNSSVAGWIDCGFTGELVIELSNHSKHPILLRQGMKIGQLVFYKHVPAEVPYNLKPTSRYLGQVGIQGSKGV